MSSSMGQNPTVACHQVVMKYRHGLDENHLVSDSNCTVINLKSPKKLQRMTNSVGDTYYDPQLLLSKKISIVDTTYHF